jgi:hypothetical protein
MLSDFLTPSYGSEALRYALGIISFVNLISAAFFFLAARKLLADLKA